jgi:hypothetical protein
VTGKQLFKELLKEKYDVKDYPVVIDGMDIDGEDIEITGVQIDDEGKRILLLTSDE